MLHLILDRILDMLINVDIGYVDMLISVDFGYVFGPFLKIAHH